MIGHVESTVMGLVKSLNGGKTFDVFLGFDHRFILIANNLDYL